MSEEKKVYRGRCLFFSNKRGYGFLEWEGEKDLFVHFSNIQAEGFKTLRPDQLVEFEVGSNHRGPQAINVRVVQEEE